MTVTDPPPTEQPTTITGHARCRWATRTPISDPVALRRAWSKGLDVEAPEVNGEAVRLYPPHDLLLVKRDGVLRTVLNADYSRLDATGYAKCSGCGCLDDPLTGDECSWCGASLDLPGGITISRRGDPS
jgi:hypothetical protein